MGIHEEPRNRAPHIDRPSSLPGALESVYLKESHTATTPLPCPYAFPGALSAQYLNMQHIHRADFVAALTTALWNWPIVSPSLTVCESVVSRLVKINLPLVILPHTGHANVELAGRQNNKDSHPVDDQIYVCRVNIATEAPSVSDGI